MKINPLFRDRKIKGYIQMFGEMTSEEAFQQAVFKDDIVRAMEFGDPARWRFINERDSFLDFAELLENFEQFPVKLEV